MNVEFLTALKDLEREKGISKEILIEAIEAALISAYKKNFGSLQNVRVHIDRATGEFKVYSRKAIVEEITDPRVEVALAEAQRIDPNYQVNDVIESEVTPREFGRIAAQTAKQVVVQRIREAERGMIYEEFSNREGDIVTGIVQRTENKNVFVDLGKVEALLAPSEQMNSETYRHNERIKAYIVEVKKTTKGPQVLISRTHPGLLKRLFELEVPEIHDGTVELKAASREAGARSKIAVYSKDENVDPVGACVGPKGMRVQAVVNELKGEKIDIVKWNPDPAKFVANALSPAKVVSVDIIEEDKVARVVVPDYQLSLAIGKEGQNARLAAKLTGWKIDIKSESQAKTAKANFADYDEDYESEYEDFDAQADENYDEAYEEEAYDEEYDDAYDDNYEEYEEFPDEYQEGNDEETDDAKIPQDSPELTIDKKTGASTPGGKK
ncbi:transcription termination/antitermination protein NusA [Heliobacterium gestii]|uniref:Transcription termination/antitermination protein NusA n=1 Tax=Heliomicrobium gestii TaxID=2699 RepID=A0A845LEH7_HELGE|nr:transcription termination factor NusA [Heliomicrobium gestii]MBM7868378.1 N utilization substance protein A [Heliomicrobium gestii]MZP44568.1 transcription termination/antitermination protein NusA [Heliomicrobium gestii]